VQASAAAQDQKEGSSVNFADQVVLITGSSSSIGFATAEAFLEAGGRVMLNGSGQEKLGSALKRLDRFGDRVDGHRADVRYGPEVSGLVEATVKRFGTLDVLVNCAGVTTSFPVLDIPEEEWDRAMEVNLKGPFLVSKAAAKVMLAQGRGGRIVNVASLAGLSPRPGIAHYGASKAGLILFTRAMAMEVGKFGITVNAVAPGVIIAKDKGTQPAPGFLEIFSRSVPLGRVGDPSDVAGAVLFLASSQAAYITGVVLTVDGGATAGRYQLPES
jgi:3-oxoacyl-[acyl-carrier protein] reductase